MCNDIGEGSRCCAGYSIVGAIFTVSVWGISGVLGGWVTSCFVVGKATPLMVSRCYCGLFACLTTRNRATTF